MNPKTSGLTISRLWTKVGPDPLDQVIYEKRNTVIRDQNGKEVFRMDDVEAPKSWSQLATDIAASKYFRKKKFFFFGIPPNLRSFTGSVALRAVLTNSAKLLGGSAIFCGGGLRFTRRHF